MKKKQEIQDELKAISPGLAEMSLPAPYRVPEGYFETLADSVMERIGQAAGLPETHPYSVPEGYFESLAGNILEKIRQQENTSSDTLPFTPEKKPAKLIQLKPGRRWAPYAAAAVLTGILVLGGFLYTNNNKDKTDYSTYSRMDVSAELNKITDTDLTIYLDNPETPATDVLAGVNNGINHMSDEELNQYLSENQDMDMFIPVSN